MCQLEVRNVGSSRMQSFQNAKLSERKAFRMQILKNAKPSENFHAEARAFAIEFAQG